MYLGITLVSMKDVSNTANRVIVLKKTREAGQTTREESNKFTAGLANTPVFTTGT